MERRGGRIGGMIGLLLVQAAADYWRLDRKPPVTAGLIAANTLIYLRPKFLNRFLPTLDQVLFNPYLILKNKDLKRFILSAFYHIGEPHLVYNMLSLLWKGIQLENQMGSLEFASMVVALLGMSQGITVLLAKTLLLFDYDRAYYYEYSVGFSGVLFALKVILYSQSDNYTNIHGIMVPARYAAWAELVLVQMLVPGVSFLGHLGGVLAGVLYLYLKSSRSGPNPVVKVFMGLVRTVSWPLRYAVGTFASSGNRFFGRGVVGRQGTSNSSAVWRCRVCTYDNLGLLSACEMCGSERADEDEWSTTSSENLTVEELRRRRVQRFIG